MKTFNDLRFTIDKDNKFTADLFFRNGYSISVTLLDYDFFGNKKNLFNILIKDRNDKIKHPESVASYFHFGNN